MKTAALVFALSLSLTTTSISQSSDRSELVPQENWQAYEDPQQAGFSTEIESLFRYGCELIGADSALVVYDGAIVFSFGDTRKRLMCHSVRKSLMSLLIGIFVEKGIIDRQSTLKELGIDDIPPRLTDSEKRARVVDLLRSRSGVYHQSAYEPSDMKQRRPARSAHEPGTHWWYNNWDFNVLLTIFEQESGEAFFDSFLKHIATPIGMQDFRLRDGYYHREPKTSIHPAYPFQMSARDLARIGVLLAHDGRWGEAEVVPAAWIRESTRPHSRIPTWGEFDGYGYMWWAGSIHQKRVISAQGTGGNSLYVLPDEKLVVVFRADTYAGGSIKGEDRRRFLEAILSARKGRPASDPTLIPYADPPNSYESVELPATYRAQFPVELPRPIPPGLTKANADHSVSLRESGGVWILTTRTPPGMNLDLTPLAPDRFWAQDLERRAAIDRDVEGRPNRFVLQGELLALARSLEAGGMVLEAERARSRSAILFPQPDDDRELIDDCIAILVELQESGEKWAYEGRYRIDGKIPIPYQVGGTAIVGMALLHGAHRDDEAAQAALRSGLAFVLRESDHPDIRKKRTEDYDMRVLGQAYALQFLSQVRTLGACSESSSEIDEVIETLVESLVFEQMNDGGWNYQNRPVHAPFVTASVVQSLLWAKSAGAKVPNAVWRDARTALESSRFEDGAFFYFGTRQSSQARQAQDQLPGSIGRSAICETTLHLLGSGSMHNVAQSIRSFQEHWRELAKRRAKAGTHEGPYLIAPYYFYYGHRYAAQAVELLPESERARQRARLRALLLETRSNDGTWNDRTFSSSKSFGTAMAVLSLLGPEIGLPPSISIARPGESESPDD